MRFTASELRRFEELSFENLVNFYRRELEAGLFEEIPRGVRKHLKRGGILLGGYNSRKRAFILSEKGKDMLHVKPRRR